MSRRSERRGARNAGWLVVAILFGLFAAGALGSAVWELSLSHELGTFGLGSILSGAYETEIVIGVIFVLIVIVAAYEYAEG